MIKKITENTLVPISLVIVLLGGVAWLTSLAASVADLKERASVLDKIDRRLSRIEGRMGITDDE